MVYGFRKDHLQVYISDTRTQMGVRAALDIESAILRVLEKKPYCTMIFAAAPSQNEVLTELSDSKRIDWTRVHAFHMDEYIGLSRNAPQGFANFLRKALFDKLPFGKVSCINSEADPYQEAARYTKLLQQDPADIVVMGIGENGHIAFNDPHAAKFDDPEWVKVVTLDDTCRNQQVHDGCFGVLDQVPICALTLTIPTLCRVKKVFCIVPAKTKAHAVNRALYGPISPACPASILRTHPAATLYLDADSASELKEQRCF